MRRWRWAVIALASTAAVVAAAIAVADNGRTDNKTFVYSVGLWGDMPYSDLQATTGVQLAHRAGDVQPKLLGARDPLDFVA
jgi:hypothetical protein